MRLAAAVANLRDKLTCTPIADLTRMPRDVVTEGSGDTDGTLYRYRGVRGAGMPVLLVPPLGAPAFAYDLRRGCSLVEYLVGSGRTVYLVDHGPISFAERRLGMEHWVDDVVPAVLDDVCVDAGTEQVHLLGWSLGGIFVMLAVAAAVDAGTPLPVRTLTAIGSPVDIAAVPLVAPLRPLAAVAGGLGLAAVYRMIGSFPGPLVRAAFQLTAVDRMVTKPLTVLSRLDDRDFLAQVEAVDHLMRNMHGYPGRVFGQIYHLLLRNNDLADGRISLAGRSIPLAAIDVPTLVVAGRGDVIAPMAAVHRVTELLTGAPEVRFETAPGGHLGVLTGRGARTSTWSHLDAFLVEYS